LKKKKAGADAKGKTEEKEKSSFEGKN